jgi:3'-phosphoadenosine 5'-phosphosulfate sulfotransferase (PAPS reductase)/FAD synthetase
LKAEKQYIASISYGKDSLAMLEVIKQHNMPLNRIVHVEIMATETIPADLPPMMEFKGKADKIIKARYGIEVEHIHAPYSYEEYFYMTCKKGKAQGQIHGFPMTQKSKAWCNKRLKIEPLQKAQRGGIAYIGIAADEPNRLADLNAMRISPLVEHGVTERDAWQIAHSIRLLSPTYFTSLRGGCWFCHNQPLKQLRLLRHDWPEYWALMQKWDIDSPVSFKPDGTTVLALDRRFEIEDRQIRFECCL